MDKLSLPNLLSLLDVNDQNSVLSITHLCNEAEALRRRRRYEKAIEVANHAVRLSHDAHNHNLHGTALLYRSLACLSSNLPTEVEQAIRDCERAITAFNLEPHNHAIAQIFRAQIDRYMGERDDRKSIWRQTALVHFRQVAVELDKLIEKWRVRGNLKRTRDYRELYDTVRMTISELSDNLIQVNPIHVAAKQRRQLTSASVSSEPSRPYTDLPAVTHQIWPLPTSLLTSFAILDSQSKPTSKSDQPALDYIEISQFSIKGEPYTLRTIYSSSNGQKLPQLRQGQQYIALRVADNGEEIIHRDEYALVRLQDQSAQPGEKVVINYTSENQGQRRWVIKDGSELGRYNNQDIKIIGVVDAALTPSESVDDRLSELLSYVDDLRAAEHSNPEISKGLAVIRHKLYKHFSKYYCLEVLPITPGETTFDPMQGHMAFGYEHDSNLPKGVILHVIGDGYLYHSKVVREAKVVVNV